MESDLPVDEAGQVAGKERDLYTVSTLSLIHI